MVYQATRDMVHNTAVRYLHSTRDTVGVAAHAAHRLPTAADTPTRCGHGDRHHDTSQHINPKAQSLPHVRCDHRRQRLGERTAGGDAALACVLHVCHRTVGVGELAHRPCGGSMQASPVPMNAPHGPMWRGAARTRGGEPQALLLLARLAIELLLADVEDHDQLITFRCVPAGDGAMRRSSPANNRRRGGWRRSFGAHDVAARVLVHARAHLYEVVAPVARHVRLVSVTG